MKKYSDRPGGFISIDGPEKAGKTYLIKRLAKAAKSKNNYRNVIVVKYTEPAPEEDWTTYVEDVRRMFADWVLHGDLVIFDRGWMSELVYGELLPGSREINGSVQTAGHLCARACLTRGLGLILLGPDTETLEKNRDDSDLPVDVATERRTYKKYADYFGYDFIENAHTQAAADSIISELLKKAERLRNTTWKYGFSAYAGNLNSGNLIILDKPQAFVNWSLLKPLGSWANKTAWTNIESFNTAMMQSVRKVVAINYDNWLRAGIAETLGKIVSIHGAPSSSQITAMSLSEVQDVADSIKDYLS